MQDTSEKEKMEDDLCNRRKLSNHGKVKNIYLFYT